MKTNHGGTEIVCPGCGIASKFYRLAKRRAFVCQYCGHQIYLAVGTPQIEREPNRVRFSRCTS
jgi:transposase